MLFRSDQPFRSWRTRVNNSFTYTLESGFDWEFSKKWDVTSHVRFTWYTEKLKSFINDSQDSFTAVVPNASFNPSASPAAGNNPGTALDVISAQPATLKLDNWNFALGLKYTFGRYASH